MTTITKTVDVTIEDIAGEVRTWSETDKRQFLIEVGLVDRQPEVLPQFRWPKRGELAAIIEPFLPDTNRKPSWWLADDIASAILAGRSGSA